MRLKISFVILVTIAAGAFYWVKYLKPVSVRVAVMRRGDIITLVYAPGEVEAEEDVVVSAEISGKITRLPVTENQTVSAGQLLFSLDKSLLSTSVSQANAGVKEAEASLAIVKTKVRPKQVDETKARLEGLKQQEEYLKGEYERALKLLKDGSIPSQKADEAKSALENTVAQKNALEKNLSLLKEGTTKEEIHAAQMRVLQAKTALRQSRQNLYKTNVFSPIAGIAVKKLAQAGEYVNPGQPVVKISGNTLRVKARVDEENIGSVRVGQTVSISFKAFPGEVFEGKVVKILKELDAVTKTVPVYVELSSTSAPDNLALGMSADINILISQMKNVMMIPKDCVAARENSHGDVFVVENTISMARKIRLGSQDASNVQVVSGLEENDAVVLLEGKKLSDGQKLQVVK